MVTMLRPSSPAAGAAHERIARPSRSTVQAPHCATPAAVLGTRQPELVAQHPQKRHVAVEIDRVRGAVDLKYDHRSSSPLSQSCGRRVSARPGVRKARVTRRQERPTGVPARPVGARSARGRAGRRISVTRAASRSSRAPRGRSGSVEVQRAERGRPGPPGRFSPDIHRTGASSTMRPCRHNSSPRSSRSCCSPAWSPGRRNKRESR